MSNKFQDTLLDILKLPTFGMLWSRLLHSITSEGKNIFLKKYFGLKKYFWWCTKRVMKKLIWKDIEESFFYKICESRVTFYIRGKVEGTPAKFLVKSFL